jgi:hypothetical protein
MAAMASPCAGLCVDVGQASAVPTTDGETPERLSTWNQIAYRTFAQKILCFPLEDTETASQQRVAQHLRGALGRLARQRPDFAGRLRMCRTGRPGSICLQQSVDLDIPFEVEDIRADFQSTYQQLKQHEFPPGAFVGERFRLRDGLSSREEEGVPVYKIRALFIHGGLLLVVAFHHAFSDGDCARMFIESFAAQTRGEMIVRASDHVMRWDEPFPKGTANELVERCDEFALSTGRAAPGHFSIGAGGTPLDQVVSTGRVFVFTKAKLRELIDLVAKGSAQWKYGEHKPSTYIILAALTWAHVLPARVATENLLADQPDRDLERSGWASLFTPVNWKARCIGFNKDDYFGNATAVRMTGFPSSEFLSAVRPAGNISHAMGSRDEDSYDVLGNGLANGGSHAEVLRQGKQGLANLAREINRKIKDPKGGVNTDFVRTRLALFDALDDPRQLVMHWDPRSPLNFGFNTWQYPGRSLADTVWQIPGVPTNVAAQAPTPPSSSSSSQHALNDSRSSWTTRAGSKPDYVGRAQASWTVGGALILPARSDADTVRLLVTLPRVSMDRLCKDQEWMSWVDHVVY